MSIVLGLLLIIGIWELFRFAVIRVWRHAKKLLNIYRKPPTLSYPKVVDNGSVEVPLSNDESVPIVDPTTHSEQTIASEPIPHDEPLPIIEHGTKSNANWGDFDHTEPDQLKRQISACDIKITPILVNYENMTGTFAGSKGEVYHVSLENCMCLDYSRRKKPCKHIYRLAHELDAFDLANNVSSLKVVKRREILYTVNKIIPQLSKIESVVLKYIVYQVVIKGFNMGIGCDIRLPIHKLIKLNLIETNKDIVGMAVSCYSVSDLKKLLEVSGIDYTAIKGRANLEKIAVENIPDIVVDRVPKSRTIVVVTNPTLEHIWKILYTTLNEIYPGEISCCDKETGIITDGITSGNIVLIDGKQV